MSVARFIADQRTNYRVPHTFTCALLGVSLSWFYKWIGRTPTPTEQRHAELDAAVATAFDKARGLHGSRRSTRPCSRTARGVGPPRAHERREQALSVGERPTVAWRTGAAVD